MNNIEHFAANKVMAKPASVTAADMAGEYFKLFFGGFPEAAILIYDGVIVNCNAKALELIGCDSDERLINKCLSDISPERQVDGSLSTDKLSDVFSSISKSGNLSFEWMHTKQNGDPLHVQISVSSINIQGKNMLFAIWRDATEQKMAREALRDSEERYHAAIEHSNDGFAVVRGDTFIYVNQKFADMFGYDRPDEIIGMEQTATIHPDEADGIAILNKKRQSGEDVPDRYEFKGKRKDGTSIYVEVSAASTQYRGEPVTLAYLRDITARKHMEEELLKSKKLESIGILAGGIAHDFNNLLMSILGYISLGKIYLKQGDTAKTSDKLTEAETAIDKAKELTRQLITFSKLTIKE